MTRDTHGIRARKSVAQMLRDFVTRLMGEFRTPPDELLRRAEERAREPPGNTQQIEQGVPDRR
jgi:hypothetical protein